MDPLSRLWFRVCVFAVVLTHTNLPEILCYDEPRPYCVCILRYLCPICYSFKFQIKGLCVTWVALISCQKTRNVSTGFLVLVRLQQGQLFVPYHSEKCLSWMAWLSLLYQAFRLQRFVELHLPTSREGEAREILFLKWMDKGKYSVKLTN